MDKIEHLESRVDKLEDDIRPLLSLPTQMNMLIDVQKQTNESIKETNASIKDLSTHISTNYVQEKICSERCGIFKDDLKDLKDFRKWVYGAIIVGLFNVSLKFVGG
ncbi:hypothetical protein [Sporomusa aerivorans]|uniref:hypothetical protein n=1 Tax=Sporomusa aerivorans TaxID=204936 RepID=UPI00352AF571